MDRQRRSAWEASDSHPTGPDALPLIRPGYVIGALLIPMLAALYASALDIAITGGSLDELDEGRSGVIILIVVGVGLVAFGAVLGWRVPPRWTDYLMYGLLAGVVGLMASPWVAVLGLAGIVIWIWAAYRAPRGRPPRSRRTARFGPAQMAGDLGDVPAESTDKGAHEGAEPADASRSADGRARDPRLPLPRPDQRPTGLDPWVVVLLGARATSPLAAVVAGVVAVVSAVGAMRSFAQGDVAVGTLATIATVVIGALTLGFAAASRAPAHELVIDNEGIARRGPTTWQLDWDDVGAVALRVIPNQKNSDTTHSTGLLLALHDRGIESPHFARREARETLAPFTHLEELIVSDPQSYAELAAALTERVPDLFVGIVED